MFDKLSPNLFRDVTTKTDTNSDDSLIELIKSIKKIEFIIRNKLVFTFRES